MEQNYGVFTPVPVSFAWKDWELLILFLCHLIPSFWLVFLFFVVVVFLNTGICSVHSHLLTHFGAVEKVGGRAIKIPPELLCMYWLIIAGVLCCGWI